MKRLACLAAGLVVFAVAFLGNVAGGADTTIKDIMTRAHKGGNSLLANIGKDLKEDEPDWADIKKETGELVDLGTQLGKATPSRGEQASWDRLTAMYLDNAKALNAAAQKMDKSGALAAQQRLATSCKACHQAHKPQ